MDKINMLKYTGTMQQLAYTRQVTVQEGRANGTRAVEVKNGDLRYLVMADKALDIAELEYKGITLSFTSKPGLNGRNHFDTHGEEALRSIMGGLFFTCGLQNICGPCETDGVEYPMHGRIRTTPAEHLSSDAYWDGDDYVLEATCLASIWSCAVPSVPFTAPGKSRSSTKWRIKQRKKPT